MKIPVNFQFRAILILALFLIALVGLKGEEPAAQQQPVVEEQQESEAQTSQEPGSKASMMDELSCETCHGPGSKYKSNTIMKDREKSIAAGLIIPDEKLCKTCHNEESPTFKGFNFEEYSKKIAHPNPAAE